MANPASTLPGLVVALQNYRDAVKRIEERQNCWNNTTKELVAGRLLALSDDLKPLKVVTQDEGKNCDWVAFGFMPTPTRIVIPEGEGAKGLNRMGPWLSYSQMLNGQIRVSISYPFIAELDDAGPDEQIAILDPEEIDEEKILKHVGQFLKAITTAETECSPSTAEHESRPPFGFNPKAQLDQAT
jgi:hypothetical protein